MNYLEKIKELNKITITSVCKELGINRSNLLNGNSSAENEKRVYDKIIEKYKSIIE